MTENHKFIIRKADTIDRKTNNAENSSGRKYVYCNISPKDIRPNVKKAEYKRKKVQKAEKIIVRK